MDSFGFYPPVCYEALARILFFFFFFFLKKHNREYWYSKGSIKKKKNKHVYWTSLLGEKRKIEKRERGRKEIEKVGFLLRKKKREIKRRKWLLTCVCLFCVGKFDYRKKQSSAQGRGGGLAFCGWGLKRWGFF